MKFNCFQLSFEILENYVRKTKLICLFQYHEGGYTKEKNNMGVSIIGDPLIKLLFVFVYFL